MSLDYAAILAAHERIRPHIHRTPVLNSSRLERQRRVAILECENSKGGAFKAVERLAFSAREAAAQRGVAAFSGNQPRAITGPRPARLPHIS